MATAALLSQVGGAHYVVVVHLVETSLGKDMYTEDAGLPYFNRAAVIANGNW